jgi:DNA-binding transcriptional LysR family regulator
MDIKKLQSFYLVAKHGNLMRAANELKVSFPAISVQIKKLERELGVGLFHHLANRLILTEQGQSFFKAVGEVFKALETAKASVANDEDIYADKVSISLGTDMAKFFAPHIASFLRKHPRLRMMLLARQPSETLSLVANGEVQLGIGRFRGIPRGIRKTKLFENGVSLVFPPRHPVSRLDRIQVKDLAPYRLILLQQGSATRNAIDRVFMRCGVEFQNVIEVGTCYSALDLVREGIGISLVHDICVLSESDKKLHCIDMTEFFGKKEVMLIYRDSAFLRMPHRELIEIFVKAAQSSQE